MYACMYVCMYVCMVCTSPSTFESTFLISCDFVSWSNHVLKCVPTLDQDCLKDHDKPLRASFESLIGSLECDL